MKSLSVTTPLVSVIIPTYNRKEKLIECLRTVFPQTGVDFEIIVINDGSTDGTIERLVEFIDSLAPATRAKGILNFISTVNSGKPSIARNIGISQARGKYLHFIDDDDLMTPDTLARHCDFLERHSGVKTIFADWFNFYNNDVTQSIAKRNLSGIKGKIKNLPRDVFTPESDSFQDWSVFNHRIRPELVYANLIRLSTVTVEKATFDLVGKFNESLTLGEDCELWLRLAPYGMAFCHTQACFARLYDDFSNLSGRVTENFLADRGIYTNLIKREMDQYTKVKPNGALDTVRRNQEQDELRKRFLKRMAEFYFDGAWALYKHRRYKTAFEFIVEALKIHPTPKAVKFATAIAIFATGYSITRLISKTRNQKGALLEP